jgi:hypothetical protein
LNLLKNKISQHRGKDQQTLNKRNINFQLFEGTYCSTN